MFPRRQRLRRLKDIQLILKHSRRLSALEYTIRVRKSNLSYPRCTVVVGLVVSKKATVRNRVKRQIRHLLREELNQLPNKGAGFDIMLTARPQLLQETSVARKKILRNLIHQVRIS